MANDQKDKRFLLRLDQSLYDRLAEEANRANQSVNMYIVSLLSENHGTKSFENCQIIGKTVSGSDVNMENGLVLVTGIYYRYLINDNSDVDDKAKYAVIEANGNILTLQKI
ncbi:MULTISPECIES: toxin-antitoxin system HicB family antitoxin [Pediococcus]|uniref:toxin-antitoxin system HicB family antitoxin n=1 Tax=Pediococcus TaxID=1253 RepID=UPI000E82303D|nr:MULTISPECIES: toxin-antitoxin system HicB family antitoxin [Pediococcus]MCT3029756.1 toxin-antitoxin system HicB family antitoxin [Pediococcus parvulus]MCT3030568.1 toxin-antitoxin system HicB family antitoxin [Pediococcus parvulus]MCT3035144.1 toxin-antitoxin system HicB family antitoxin [Pediococcus parvulus]MDN5575547.1 toxin-antitoxin system HicB family antitoxin [Pediococcus sp.]HBO48199.1 toxin-antitoxin system HicB family antitoxin [Pediococcus sp.]